MPEKIPLPPLGETVTVLDHGVPLTLTFEACRLYHGEDSIGGLALGFRLLCWALPQLAAGALERGEIAFATAFPGPGLTDAVEMVTRARSRGMLTVLDSAPQCAPQGVYGRMYFEVSARGKALRVVLAPGAVSEEFVQTGRLVKAGSAEPAVHVRWERLKRELACAVIAADPEQLFAVVPEEAALETFSYALIVSLINPTQHPGKSPGCCAFCGMPTDEISLKVHANINNHCGIRPAFLGETVT